MRGSRALWLSFAVAIVVALAVIPMGVARSRSTAASLPPSASALSPAGSSTADATAFVDSFQLA